MRIIIDLTSLADNFSGIERYASNIAFQLVKNYEKHQYILIFKNSVHKQFNEFENLSNVEMVILNGSNKLLFSQVTLMFNLYRYRGDAYLFMAFPPPLLFFSEKSKSTIHDIGCWDCPKTMKINSRLFFRISYRKIALFSKYIITVSNFSKKRISNKLHFNFKNIKVISNGLSDVFLNEDYNHNETIDISAKYKLPKNYFLCLSTIEPRKNLVLLIKAYSELMKENELGIELVLAGRKGWKVDDLLDDLEENVIKKIHFTGFIDDEDLPYVYKNAVCFVFPSIYEGFGIPPLEAMAMGTPVIASNASSLPEVLGEGAIYFENNDLQSLMEKLLKVYGNINYYNSKKNKKIMKKQVDKYSWSKSAKEMMYFIESTK